MLLARTHFLHSKKSSKAKSSSEGIDEETLSFNETAIKNASEFLVKSNKIYSSVIDGLIKEDRKALRKLHPRIEELNKLTKYLKDNIHKTISLLGDENIEAGPHHVQELDYMREMAHCLTFIHQPVFKHIDNNHKGLIPIQHEELIQLNNEIQNLSETIRQSIIKAILKV